MDIHEAFSGSTGHGHQCRSSCTKTTDPDMALCGRMALGITMALGGRCSPLR